MKTLNIKWLWVLGGLLFLNLGLLLYILFNKNGTSERRPPRAYFEETLGFSPEQRQKFELLKEEHQEMMMLKNQQIRILKDKLFSRFGNDKTFDEAEQLAVKIGILVSEIDLETRKHFEEVRDLCSDDQKEKFDKSMRDMLRPEGPPNGKLGNQGPPPIRPKLHGPGIQGVGGPPPPHGQ